MADQNLLAKIIIAAEDKASSVLETLKDNAGTIAATIAGYFGVSFFQESVEDAKKFEEQMGILQSVIDATGSAAGLTTSDIEAMAKRIGDPTEIRAAAAELLTFKSVGKETFETTLSLAKDLATAGFGTIEGNAIQLGKALEDPVKGLTSLTKSGVTFTESEQNLIKSLVDSGEQLKAQGIIIDAVTKQVGGAGAGADVGLAGAMDNVSERFLYAKEQIGSAFLPVMTKAYTAVSDFLGLLVDTNVLSDFAGKIAGVFQEGIDWAQKFATSLDFSSITESADTIKSKFLELAQSGKQVFDDLTGAISNVISALADSGAISAFGNAFNFAINATIELFNGLFKTIDTIFQLLNQTGAIGVFANAMRSAIGSIIDLAAKLAEPFIDLFKLLNNTGTIKSFGQIFSQTLGYMVDAVSFFVRSFTVGIGAVTTAFNVLAGVGAKVAQTILDGVAQIQKGMAEITFGDVSKRWQAAADESKKIAEAFAESAKVNFDAAGKSLEKVAELSGAVLDSFNRLDSGIGEVGNTTQTATAAAESFNGKLQETAVSGDQAAAALDKTGAAAERAAGSMDQAKTGVAGVSNEVKNLAQDLSKLNNEQLTQLANQARLAFEQGRIGAEELQRKLAEISDQQLTNIGVKYDDIKQSAREFANEAVNAYQAAYKSGQYNTAQMKELAAAIISTAKTSEDLQALVTALQNIGVNTDSVTLKMGQLAASAQQAASAASAAANSGGIDNSSQHANLSSGQYQQTLHAADVQLPSESADSYAYMTVLLAQAIYKKQMMDFNEQISHYNDVLVQQNKMAEEILSYNLSEWREYQKTGKLRSQRAQEEYQKQHEADIAAAKEKEKADKEAAEAAYEAAKQDKITAVAAANKAYSDERAAEIAKANADASAKREAVAAANAQHEAEVEARRASERARQEQAQRDVDARNAELKAQREQERAAAQAKEWSDYQDQLAASLAETEAVNQKAKEQALAKAEADKKLTQEIDARRDSEVAASKTARDKAKADEEAAAQVKKAADYAKFVEESKKRQAESKPPEPSNPIVFTGGSNVVYLDKVLAQDPYASKDFTGIRKAIDEINSLSYSYSVKADLVQQALVANDFNLSDAKLDRIAGTDHIIVSFKMPSGKKIDSLFQSKDQATQFIELLKQGQYLSV